MLERLSDQAVRATELARDEARALGHDHIGTEHLLLGILAEGDNPAARALLASGATLYGCREMAAEAVGDAGGGRLTGELAYSERASRALERASRLALRRRHPAVETTHILASVLDVEGRAGQVLRGLGVDPARVHHALDDSEVMAPAPADAPAPAPVPAEADGRRPPRCAHCGVDLEGGLGQRLLTARDGAKKGRAWLVAYCLSCGSAIGATAPAGQD